MNFIRVKTVGFTLNEKDNDALDELLGAMLDAYRDGKAGRDSTVGTIGLIVRAAAKDDIGTVRKWLHDAATLSDWWDAQDEPRPT